MTFYCTNNFFNGIRGISNKWFANYLSNRKQYTKIHIRTTFIFDLYKRYKKSISLKLLSFVDETINCLLIISYHIIYIYILTFQLII